MDVTEGRTGEVTRNGRARTLQSSAKEKRLTKNQRVRAGRKEVERFVGQQREFDGNGRSNRRVRRTGRLVLGAAFLGVALLLLTACGGDTGSGDTGSGDTGSTATGSISTGEQYDSTREESTSPISPVCQPPDMENCYGYEDMQAYLDQIIPMIEQFFDTAYADISHPTQYVYVSEGESVSTGCGGITDAAYAYCRADGTIYIGQRTLWDFYSVAGDAAPAVGLAHEWGHHVQNVAGVPPRETLSQVGQISRENQADCISGAWVAYAEEQGWLNYPDDLGDIETLLRMIAEYEPWRTHGDLDERTNSLEIGYTDGLQGCNGFFPDTPVIE